MFNIAETLRGAGNQHIVAEHASAAGRTPGPASGSKPACARENRHFLELEEIQSILDHSSVEPVFQPILELTSGEIFGHEGLIRGPAHSPLHEPAKLFAAAGRAGLAFELDMLCCREVIRHFARFGISDRLFLNVSPPTVLGMRNDIETLAGFIRDCGLRWEQVTIELTETQQIANKDAFRDALLLFRSKGFRVALDDLGEGFSSLRLWSELHPDFVKIDMHFVQGISQSPFKFQFLKSLQQIADNCGSTLVAEGVEDVADFRLLRDLGIAFTQGYLISKPTSAPLQRLAPTLHKVLDSSAIAVYPDSRVIPNRTVTVDRLMLQVPPASPRESNELVFQRFAAEPDLDALPVVEGDRPRGLINRHRFVAQFARPYYHELHGRKSCALLMDPHPLIVEKDVPIQELSEILVESDQRHLADGFVIVEAGNYAGYGRSRDLIREITRLQLETARYANPLTLLPGNVPINEHIARLLAARSHFAAAYCDLNHFKPFNDAYGYQLGDEIIKLCARILSAVCDPRRDFVGHIGGDDFMVLFQSADWDERCREALRRFDRDALHCFTPEDRSRGCIRGEDRRGNELHFPLTSLAIGGVVIKPGEFTSHLEVAAVASEAKKLAKRQVGSNLWIERREARPA